MSHASPLCLLLLCCGYFAWSESARDGTAAASTTDTVARHVDDLLHEEIWSHRGVQPLPVVDDYVFLRRVSFDIIGRPPSPAAIGRFVASQEPDKRGQRVDQLLASLWYGDNWARYWRDVMLYRRSEDRALLTARVLADYLAEQFNENVPWNEIASAFVTAAGDVKEHGETALIMAQSGRPEETVAEISRIFLGIQIQCAQCHDHPYDRWQREQFHELAAFFPRVALRPNRQKNQRTFLVVSNDRPATRRPLNVNNRYRGTPEHRMPDLENPQAAGTVMTPTFFLSGETIELGTRDADRRQALASWLTSPDNRWFAKAFVNRMWTELLGSGFFEAVDDLGPDRDCQAPRTLDYLSTAFIDSGYDIKWLLATIIRTDAYQRECRSREVNHKRDFLVNHAQRLRADQLYNALATAVRLRSSDSARGAGQRGNRDPRLRFAQFFGYDPSMPREEVSSSVPQALQLMNSPLIERMIDARRPDGLGRLLRETSHDDQLITALYLRCFSRRPARHELKQARQHIRRSESREDGAEDVLWALINSSEFRYRG